ncbi:hypothetical protein [Paenibacillus elgii]|uniref:hypothetical protein n=1 Tax=Paenibacillus elgii TaxID=189691 RepID=UPI0013D45771|nr:hypothetical protein [Paenibacillus elgii]
MTLAGQKYHYHSCTSWRFNPPQVDLEPEGIALASKNWQSSRFRPVAFRFLTDAKEKYLKYAYGIVNDQVDIGDQSFLHLLQNK